MRKIELPKTFLNQPSRTEIMNFTPEKGEKRKESIFIENNVMTYNSFLTQSGNIDLSEGNIFDPGYTPEEILPPEILDYATESPQREGLRRKRPEDEKQMGINNSPSFGLTKKMYKELEEENNENIENEADLVKNTNNEEIFDEGELDKRVFRSIENLIKPGKSKKEKAKETIDKEMFEIRKEIEDCDVFSGKLFENFNVA